MTWCSFRSRQLSSQTSCRVIFTLVFAPLQPSCHFVSRHTNPLTKLQLRSVKLLCFFLALNFFSMANKNSFRFLAWYFASVPNFLTRLAPGMNHVGLIWQGPIHYYRLDAWLLHLLRWRQVVNQSEVTWHKWLIYWKFADLNLFCPRHHCCCVHFLPFQIISRGAPPTGTWLRTLRFLKESEKGKRPAPSGNWTHDPSVFRLDRPAL